MVIQKTIFALAGLMLASAAVSAQETQDTVSDHGSAVIGEAPSISMGNLEQANDQALSNSAHNATSSQMETNVTAQAATTMGVSSLFDTDSSSAAVAQAAIFDPTPIECKTPSPVPLAICGPSGPPLPTE